MEALAAKHGYKKVSQMQLAVVNKIRDFVGSGGNMFAMCSATETFDIALAAAGTDICDSAFDGDSDKPKCTKRSLDFSKCFAFKDFLISTNPYEYWHSTIDKTVTRMVPENLDYFSLVSSPAKMDIVPVMLCKNHTKTIAGFMGQTTAFRKNDIKPGVMILGGEELANVKQDGNPANNRVYNEKYGNKNTPW